MPTYPKHSKKPRIRSTGSKAKAPKASQMAMNRKVTRDAYQAREIEQSAPSKAEARKSNQAGLDKFQATLKPIKSSQK